MIRAMSDTATSSALPRKDTVQRPPSGKQRILEAAERLFARSGFMDVSAAEIAREAGVAHGLLFHHFGSMEDLYAEVSRVAARRMDELQSASFRGRTVRERIAAFLRAHLRAVKQRQGDAVFRARSQNLAINGKIAEIWESSRQRAIDRLCETLGIAEPTPRMRVCLRAWIGFHDQLVLGWLADRAVSEAEVLEWTLRQLAHLAADVLGVDLDRRIAD
jgi:AcrR family transcriptional regulator